MREMKDSGVEWIGEIPSSWKVVSTKFLFQILSGATPDSSIPEYWDGDITWITPADYKTKDVYVDSGRRCLSKIGFDSCSTSMISAGSIIFSKRAPIGSVAINQTDLCTNQGCLSCVSKGNSFAKYYYYVMSVATEHYELLGSGTTFKEISATNFGNFALPYPDYQIQIEISNYLDGKCAQVNTLIANVQAQIEKLKDYKQSVITEVVTKGLDPTVPMKDSGFEWIGEIPAHWGVTRIKNMFELWNERNDEADLTKVNLISLYTDLGVVQHSDLTATTGNRAVTAEGYKIVRKHDIVVNIILCWMGAVGMSQYDGVTSPAYDIYRPLKDTNSEYYHYLFRTNRFNGECYRYGRGIMMMRWRTYSTEFRAINIPCPPAEEQKKIVTHLNEKCNKIDQLIAIKQAKIEKLEQYKRSLIYEYVTGKKKVR